MNWLNIKNFDIIPIYDLKAKLSAWIKKLKESSRKVLVTCNGRPEAVLISYEDYLALVDQKEEVKNSDDQEIKTINYEEWKKDFQENKIKVCDSILNMFNVEKLSRKGKKAYKAEAIKKFAQKSNKKLD